MADNTFSEGIVQYLALCGTLVSISEQKYFTLLYKIRPTLITLQNPQWDCSS
jgi:hypothetical protein